MKDQIQVTNSRQPFAPALVLIPPASDISTPTGSRPRPERVGRQHSRLLTLLALAAFGFRAVALALPNLASAQTLVPLVPIPTNQNLTVSARHRSNADWLRQGASPVYVDASLITYPSILPGPAIAGPAGPDIQVNDPSLDHIQVLDEYPHNSPDFEFCTQSETSLATDGSSNIVVSYNSTAGIHVVDVQTKDNLFTDLHLTSAYSVSHDGGLTWRSGFIPTTPHGYGTAGDGVVAADRAGNFYYATMGRDSNFNSGMLVSKSTDHGNTFAPSQVVALDAGVDKPWIGVGPDPSVPSRDNVYVIWDSYDSTGTNSTLAFSRSTDAGTTWSPARTLFAYSDDGVLSGQIQPGNPTVDKSNGRLYVTFLHYDHINGGNSLYLFFGGADYLRVLASDDGGNTFTPLTFNVPGAPNPFGYPVLQVGVPADLGAAEGAGTVVKQGPNIGGGIWGELYGLPRFVHCSQIVAQPLAAAQNERLVIVFESSISDVATNPFSRSQIIALYSKDAGRTWFPPFVVAPATTADPQHFHPALALAPDGNTLYVDYYVQQSNEQVRVEMATLHLTGGGLQLLGYKQLSSVAFDLEPSDIPSPKPPLKSDDSVNFDFFHAGYMLGEYIGMATDPAGNPLASWGDGRNSWVSPADGYYPGVHPQTDVFFVRP